MTRSEGLFEEFCAQRGISIRRIAESKDRSPDYEIEIGGKPVIVEVKEIGESPEDREANEKLARGEAVVRNIKPGEKVRKKIAAQGGQIRARTEGCKPGVLILFDDGQTIRHLDPYQIRVAMEGFDTVVLAVPKDPREEVRTLGTKAGPRKKMTQNDNTSISAIGVLSLTKEGQPDIQIYHNRHAQVPLPPGIVAAVGIPQFQMSDGPEGAVRDWVRI
jgi:hypothetical protein